MKSFSNLYTIFMILFLIGTGRSYGQPGTGILVGEHSVLSPSYTFTLGYTDNINLRRRALSEEGAERLDVSDEDFYLDHRVELSLNRQGAVAGSTLRSWYSYRDYLDEDNLSSDVYGISGNSFVQSDSGKTRLTGNLTWQRAVESGTSLQIIDGEPSLEQQFENVAQRVERDELSGRLGLSYQFLPRWQVNSAYSFSSVDYADEAFTDLVKHTVTGGLSYSILSWADLGFTVGREYFDYDFSDSEKAPFEGWEDPYYQASFNARRNIELTEKIDFSLRGGVRSRTSTQITEEGEERVTEVNDTLDLDGGFTYAYSPKTTLRLNIRNGFSDTASPDGTPSEEASATFSITNRLMPGINQRFSISRRNDDFLQPIRINNDLVDEKKVTTLYSYTIDYNTPRPWLSLFGRTSYEEGESEVDTESFEEFTVQLGFSLRY